jgi:hypothetical protein
MRATGSAAAVVFGRAPFYVFSGPPRQLAASTLFIVIVSWFYKLLLISKIRNF